MTANKDFIYLTLVIFAARYISITFGASYLVTTLLFFGVPSLFITLRIKNKIIIKKALFFAAISLFPAAIVDTLGIINHSWTMSPTVFPGKLLGVMPGENIIWSFLLVYSVIVFYEHYFDQGRNIFRINNVMKSFIIFFILLFLGLVIVYYNLPEYLYIRYYYFYCGLVFVLYPSLFFLIVYRRLSYKFLLVGIYFFALCLFFEITALDLGHWKFVGAEYIGWINIFQYRFPFEEFFFWLVMFSSAILSFYEFLFDDRK